MFAMATKSFIQAEKLLSIFEDTTMKAFVFGFLTFLSFPCCSAGAKDLPMNYLQLKIKTISPSGIITVEMVNLKREPLKIWRDSNSWGAARWRVLLLRKGRLDTFFQNPDQVFTVNVPMFREVAGMAHEEQKFDLNSQDWRGQTGEVHFESGDMIIVIYDVPVTPEAVKMRVWYGVATALTTVP